MHRRREERKLIYASMSTLIMLENNELGDHVQGTSSSWTRRQSLGFLKRHPTSESSVLGTEFVAMKNGMEATRELRYKLRG